MSRFATMLREGAVLHQAAVERRRVREAREARTIIAEALAPVYARDWDRAMRSACPELFNDPRASASTVAAARRRDRPLRQRMAPYRRGPEGDDAGDGWDVALAPFVATAAEIAAHHRAHEPSPADQNMPAGEPSRLIVAPPEGRGAARSGADSALSRLWRRMFSPA